jgi:hypothetical protein
MQISCVHDRKPICQTIFRMANLSSINCFDTHGNGQTDPVIFTAQTYPAQQRLGTLTNNAIYANTDLSPVFYNPYPKIMYKFPISNNFLNNRYFDFTIIMQIMPGDSIILSDDQITLDLFYCKFHCKFFY